MLHLAQPARLDQFDPGDLLYYVDCRLMSATVAELEAVRLGQPTASTISTGVTRVSQEGSTLVSRLLEGQF